MLHYRGILGLIFLILFSADIRADEAQQIADERNILQKTADASKETLKSIGTGTKSASKAVIEGVIINPATTVVEKTEKVIETAGEGGRKLGERVANAINDDNEFLVIEVNGVKGALAENIDAHLKNLPESSAERATFLFSYQEDIQQAMQALGYYRGQIDASLNRDVSPWQLSLQITPGEPMRYRKVSIQIRGAAKSDPAFKLRLKRAKIAKGDVVHHGKYETLKSDLVSLGLIRGYFDGSMVTQRIAIDRDKYQAELVLVYDSNQRYTFGEVNFAPFDLEDDLLFSMVQFKPNEPYHNDQVSDFTGTLLSSGYFKEVKVFPQPQRSKGGQIPIDVELSPSPSHSFELGAGYSTDTEGRVSITWRTPQVNRYGHSQETRLEISKVNPELSFEYRIPLDHPLNDILQLGSSFGKEEFGDLESQQTQLSISRKTVLGGGWTRRYFIRYLNESWDQAGISTTSDYLLPGISFNKTTRRGPTLDPSSGFRQLYTIEHGSPIDSDAEATTRLRGQWRFVASPFDRQRFTSRLDLGYNNVSDESVQQLAPSLRFFAGGDQTVRGYSYQSLAPTITTEDGTKKVVGGRYLATASVEYQYYLSDKWRAATFLDGGSAFNESHQKDIDWAGSVGLGIHWISPIGPLRLDLGYGFTEDDPPYRLHITIGAEL
ncbi:autotransporter assembly complex protein TamA [Ferrimonas lipolytica]|uniref:Translocation and assembly module subunit TamA n=1 Tax=Ferrimonas lipolytica TaxID=2724191 RepID=A0A6H1UAJ8_9GAMM|nr:autotransporter assembly complex family protein [Ferrimonas lipolytica]QIZ76087.1 outer membrane protein assembly factor [Ferrimonas lipolytica]